MDPQLNGGEQPLLKRALSNNDVNPASGERQVPHPETTNKMAVVRADQTLEKTTKEIQPFTPVNAPSGTPAEIHKRVAALGEDLLQRMERSTAAGQRYAKNPGARGEYIQALQEERKAILDGDTQLNGHPLASLIRGTHRSRVNMIEQTFKQLGYTQPEAKTETERKEDPALKRAADRVKDEYDKYEAAKRLKQQTEDNPDEKILKQEFQDLRDRIDSRIKATNANIRYLEREIQNLGRIGRFVARFTGTLRGMRLSLEADQKLLNSYGKIRSQLDTVARLNPKQRREGFQRLWKDLGATRPDYRDANAQLARSVDTIDTYDYFNVITTPQPRAPFVAGQEVYTLTERSTVERGWRVMSVSENRIAVRPITGGALRVLTPQQVWHVGEIDGARMLPRNVPRHVQAEMQNRRNTLMQRYARITEEEYHQLFDGPLQQQNVGNCYLIAAFNSLRHSPHAEVILRTSVQRQGTGFIVKIPLGNADGTPIAVSAQDMQAMTIPTDSHGRTQLQPVNAAPGWVALEAAFIIKRFGRLDRRAAEGGLGEAALSALMGNAVQTLRIRNNFATLSEDARSREQAIALLNSFSPERHILTASSRVFQDERSSFRTGPHTFLTKHAYSIFRVDPGSRQIILANPHNTAIHIQVTYDEFLTSFRGIGIATVNDARIFRV